MSRKPEKDFIQSIEEKRRRIREAGASDDHGGAKAVVVLDHTWGTVEECGLGNVYNNRIVKILTKEGIADWSVLRFDYDPRSYVNQVHEIRIHRADGSVEELDPESFRDMCQPERLLFWRVRMKLYSLPRLAVGDAVEWVSYRKGFQIAYLAEGADPASYRDPETGLKPPMYGAFYDIVQFREKLPVKEKRYTLMVPETMPLYSEVYHGDVRAALLPGPKGYRGYSWTACDVKGYAPEARMWKEQKALTKLLVSSVADWRDKSRWFWGVNEKQFEADDAIRAKTAEVTRGLKTDDEKADALCHWVAQEIRYIGFTVSEGEGFTLHPGTMTFHERGGVCKDIAGMLITMMRALGLDAYPAQTEPLNPVDRVTADQFGHCVVAWKKPDGSIKMLDPTWAIYSMDVWDTAETQQNYLAGTPEGEDLGCTDLHKPEDSLLRVEGQSSLTAKGAVKGRASYQGLGRSDSTQRAIRMRQPAHRFPAILRGIFSAIDPEVEIGKHRHGDVDDLTKPYENVVDWSVKDYGLVEGDRMALRLPMARWMTAPVLCRYLEEDKLEKREFDMQVIYLQKIEVDETLRLPKGWRLASRPFRIEEEAAPASYSARLDVEGDALRFRAAFALKQRSITPKDYPAFRKVVGAAKDMAARWIRLERDGRSSR